MLVVESCDAMWLVIVAFQQVILWAIVIIAIAPKAKAVVTLIPQPFPELTHDFLFFNSNFIGA